MKAQIQSTQSPTPFLFTGPTVSGYWVITSLTQILPLYGQDLIHEQ